MGMGYFAKQKRKDNRIEAAKNRLGNNFIHR